MFFRNLDRVKFFECVYVGLYVIFVLWLFGVILEFFYNFGIWFDERDKLKIVVMGLSIIWI